MPFPLRILFKRILKLLAKQLPAHKLRRSLLKAAGYKIGRDVYIGEDIIIIDELGDKGLLRVGNRVAIAERVTFVISSNPNLSRITPYVPVAHGPITVEDDAWIGTGVIIMPNLTIGEGSVIGAGSVVTKNIPAFTIVAGVPARGIKKVNMPEK